MASRTRHSVIVLVLLVLAIALPPYLGVYYTRFATQIAIYGMAALSVDLLLGYTGLITFGQSAFFGIGAYATGMLTVSGVTSAFLTWPAAVLIAMLAALVIGSLSLRTRGFQFIMLTLAFAQMAYYLAESLRSWGGDDGFTIPHRNHLATLGLQNQTVFYYVVLALLVITLFITDRVVQSQFGMVIRSIRDNERRTAAIGFSPYPYKLAAFVIAGGIAGLAGALMANHAGFVGPSLLSWQLSGELLAMVILGSANSLIGAVVGAAFFLGFRDVLSSYTEHWMLFFGLLLVARVLLLKDGIWGLVVNAIRLGPRAAPVARGSTMRPAALPRGKTAAPVQDTLLEVTDLHKSFGALAATDGVSLAVLRGETHALIGPNGAGKTTLIGQLTGELIADDGEIRFDGRDITRLSTAERARLGLARSFQITSIFDSFTAEGNVAVAVQATESHSFRFWRRAGAIPRLRESAHRLLQDVGLAECAERVVSHLSHGQRRQIEICMAFAAQPSMLLLDEPMAGLGVEETQAMSAMIGRLKKQYTILLVEHDMDVVFSLADRISVLVGGQIVATGTVDEIRDHPAVRTAYLGNETEFDECDVDG